MANSESWKKIFNDHGIKGHDFDASPFYLSAQQIKESCQNFTTTTQKEVRILCKQDTRESRPDIFKELGLFLLPVKNGHYAIVRGEGYIDIPRIKTPARIYNPKLDFELDTAMVGDSEMQHLDYAYAVSLIRSFMDDPSLVLTIRGRKYTPAFDLRVGKHKIEVNSVQTEVDAGYEGKNQVVLIEAKNINTTNVIIRQLYYPFRQWQQKTKKKVSPLFFDRSADDQSYSVWQFEFSDPEDYNSARCVRMDKFKIED